VTKFGLLSIPQRLGSVAATLVGIAGVVAVLVGVLSIAAGFQKAMSASWSPDAVIVLRSGADTEMVSGFSREQTRIIADAPGLARTTNGPVASAELFVIINLPKRSTGTDANVPLRGVEPPAFLGRNEVIVGGGAGEQFAGLDLGGTFQVGRHAWAVVGIFSAGGGTAESEIWTDATVLQDAYNRGETYQSVYAKLSSAEAFTRFKDALTSDPRLSVKPLRQTDYYADQSTAMTKLITTLGVLIAFLMAVGAVFGALNTMYSAVSARTREIATLRALGFGSGTVIVSVLFESLLVALAGGVCGAGLAYVAFNDFHAATMNWQSFSQVAFAFQVTPALLVRGLMWALLIGFVGGLFPAVRAARLPVAAALRES
jgi:putative ABC transport system permease protein